MYLLVLLTALLSSSTCHGYTGINRAGDTIYRVHKNSPAAIAGVKVGDKVLLIDGVKSGDIDGPAGTEVTLTLRRKNKNHHTENGSNTDGSNTENRSNTEIRIYNLKRVPHDEAYQ